MVLFGEEEEEAYPSSVGSGMTMGVVTVKDTTVDEVLFVMVLFEDIMEVLNVVPALVVFLVVPVAVGERSELSGREEEVAPLMDDDSLQLVEVGLVVPSAVRVEDEAEGEDGEIEGSVLTGDDERVLRRADEAGMVVGEEILPEEDEVLFRRIDEVEEVVPMKVVPAEVAPVKAVPVEAVPVEAVPVEVVLEEDGGLPGRDDESEKVPAWEDDRRLLRPDKVVMVVVPGEDDRMLLPSDIEDEVVRPEVELAVPLGCNVISVEALSVGL